jgi:hypothetical protein
MKMWTALLVVIVLALPLCAETDVKPSAATPIAAAASRDIQPPASQAKALPVGTAIKMKLETPISTRSSNRGDVFAGRVTEPVTLDGQTIIPVGAALQGRVLRADEPRRIRGTPTIDLRPDVITMPNGERRHISAVIVDTDHRPEVDVNEEGKIKGRGHDGGDLKETAVGTGAGATIGLMAGGAKGMGVGAAIGAGGTVIHWLTKRKTAELPAGTEIVMELSRPMTISGN